MSAELSVFLGITYTRDGVTRQYGSLESPIRTVTLDGDFADETEFAIAASTTVDVWAYAAGKPDFALLTVQSDGALEVCVKMDAPTSSTDLTALTTHVNYHNFQIESHAPFILSSDNGRVEANATAKNSNGIGAATSGKVYLVQIRNNGTTERKATVRVFN